MLKELKKLVALYGSAKIAQDLGYRSSGTLTHWFKQKKIPATATLKVKEYLENAKHN